MNLLEIILITNFVFIMLLCCIKNTTLQKIVGLYGSYVLLGLSFLLWANFDRNSTGFSYESAYKPFDSLNIMYHLGIDGLSIYFVILSILLLPICILCSWTTVTYKVREFYILLYVITFLLIQVFTVLDILLFYIYFESLLIPMFILIGIWGSRERKIHAAYQFFLYTLVGSVIMLLAIIYVYATIGSTNLYVLLNYPFELYESKVIWLCFFASFAVKVPMLPFHIWLPEAHVEAPTAGSVILAGILLKMGTYGLLRFSIPMFPEATLFFQPLVYLISLIGIIYASCTTIRQIDLKKIIAYSSVGHMNFVMLGLISNNVHGIEGSVFLMLSHGLVSSALFLCVGLLYERYHTRIILYYGGLIYGMPIFGIFFLFYTLANVSLPGTSSFVGEFLILLGVAQVNYFTCFMAATSVILGAVYAFWLYNRVMFGYLRIKYIQFYSDLNLKEVYLLFMLALGVLYMGIYPKIIIETLHLSSLTILEYQI